MESGDKLILRVGCLLAILLSAATGYSAPTAPKGPLKITRVGLDKKMFDPSTGETVSLGFEVTKQAGIRVAIYDRLGRQVRSFDILDMEAGRHSITWDGRTADGKLPAGNVFLYVIEAKSNDRERFTYNPAPGTGGLEVKSLEYTLDTEKGKIEYVLPKACMIRIRAGLKDGMFAGSIFDWRPMTAGRHTYYWDGKDNSGQMYLLKHQDLDLRLTCYTLPANTIITAQTEVPFDTEDNAAETESPDRSRLWATKGKYFHYQHDPRICHQPRFNVLFPTKKRLDSNNTAIVSGIVPVRIELDPRDARHLINRRFEIMLFVDGVFIYEIEEGSSPFTFNWDTADFARGPHILTVNLIAYDDHIGSVSCKVILGE